MKPLAAICAIFSVGIIFGAILDESLSVTERMRVISFAQSGFLLAIYLKLPNKD